MICGFIVCLLAGTVLANGAVGLIAGLIGAMVAGVAFIGVTELRLWRRR